MREYSAAYQSANEQSHGQVATLLEGDYFDMFALLRWADQVASQPNQVLVGNMQFWWSLWTDIQKRGMLQMELDLMKTFRQVESNYRAEHGLNVGKVQREGVRHTCIYFLLITKHRANTISSLQNGATATYDGLISDGRAGLGQLHPAAASNVCSSHLKSHPVHFTVADINSLVLLPSERLRRRALEQQAAAATGVWRQELSCLGAGEAQLR